MAKIIQHQFFFPNPPELVWEYLTNAELMSQWLMKSNFLPILGHEFQFRINPMPNLEFDGVFYCKVLEITPFKKLSYSWKFGPGDGTMHDSEVNWTLTEQDNGTGLQLVHRGFAGADTLPLFIGMDGGWLSNIQKIMKLING
jgi:uncharacterized protein YndB with AHSA1/START domain